MYYNFSNADKNVAWKLQPVERRCLLVSDLKPFLRFFYSTVRVFEVVRKERVSYAQDYDYDKFDLAFVTICSKKHPSQRTYSKEGADVHINTRMCNWRPPQSRRGT